MSDAPKYQTKYPELGLIPLNDAARNVLRTWDVNSLEELKSGNYQLLPVITMWYRLDEKGRWQFNHYDDGHKDLQKGPRSKVPEHDKVWKNGKWGYARANLKQREGISPAIINQDAIIPVK